MSFSKRKIMGIIKVNKILLILAFFMPFTMTMCSRSQNFHSEQIAEGNKIMTNEPAFIKYFAYLLYPTEYSASGFGFTYKTFEKVIDGRFELEPFQSIPLAFICSFFGLIFTFYQKQKLVFYLSVMNLACLLLFAITGVVYSFLDNAQKAFFEFVLWGFWIAVVLSVIDVYLTRKNIYS